MDLLFDRIQDEFEENGEPSTESKERFEQLCEVFGDKVDRIGRFIRVMEARATYCKAEAARLSARGKTAENKVEQTKALIMYFSKAVSSLRWKASSSLFVARRTRRIRCESTTRLLSRCT